MPTFSQLWGDDLSNELGTNDTSVLFTDARRKHAINEGLRKFANLTECVVTRSSVTVSSSAQEFNLLSTSNLSGSSRFLRIASEGPAYITTDTAGNQQILAGARDFPQVAIPAMDAVSGEWRSTESPGDPTGWYLRKSGGALYFGLDRPADVSTSETAELLIPFVAHPSSMTDSTHVPFAVSSNYRRDLEPYHQGVVHYAAHLMEKLRRDDERANAQLKAFTGYVALYKDQDRPKGARHVRSAGQYFRRSRFEADDVNSLRAPWWR